MDSKIVNEFVAWSNVTKSFRLYSRGTIVGTNEVSMTSGLFEQTPGIRISGTCTVIGLSPRMYSTNLPGSANTDPLKEHEVIVSSTGTSRLISGVSSKKNRIALLWYRPAA